jgi:hypothetical protein
MLSFLHEETPLTLREFHWRGAFPVVVRHVVDSECLRDGGENTARR